MLNKVITGLLLSLSLNSIVHAEYLFHRSLPTMGANASGGIGGTTPGNPNGGNGTGNLVDNITLSDYYNGYLPFGKTGSAYNFDMKTLATITGTSHTVADLNWTITGGAFPDGMALATTGEITGVPATATGTSVQIQAATPNGVGDRVYNIMINDVAVMQAFKVASGTYHTCVINTNKQVFCWGANSSGQLGDGTTVERTNPMIVSGLPTDITDIVTGTSHVCVLSPSQGVKCWGNNNNGQVGDGVGGNTKTTPVSVVGLPSDITSIKAGSAHTCATSASQGLMCWGSNAFGQLGDGTVTDRPSAIKVSNVANDITHVAMGTYHTCARSSSQGLACWGNNGFGQIGDGSTANRLIPVSVYGAANDIIALGAGQQHTCAMSTTQGMTCWGNNTYGQLGNGSNSSISVPASVSNAAWDISIIEGGIGHTCAYSPTEGVKCWGRNHLGQLGDNTTTNRQVPTSVVGLPKDISQMDSLGYTTCAASASKGLMCWGYNLYGQLLDGTTNNSTTPKQGILP